jgi:hypothetical protein
MWQLNLLLSSFYFWFAFVFCVLLLFWLGKKGGVENVGLNTYFVRPLWTAYVGPILSLLVYFVAWFYMSDIFEIMGKFAPQILSFDFLVVRMVSAILIFLMHTFLIYRAWRKYMRIDENGVWYYQGIFPWTVTADGLTWKNLERGWLIQGFSSWVLRSWTVRIIHRYNSDKRFDVKHMPQEAVSLIDDMAQREPN